MEGQFWGILFTFVELLGLVVCLGALICRLWVLPADLESASSLEARLLLRSIWRLLGGMIGLLAVGTIAQFLLRVSAMIERPIMKIPPMLPTVLLQTHYGWVWMLRAVMLLLLAACWLGRKGPGTRTRAALMLGMAAVIGLTRSLTGHAADWGDPSFAEFFDWMHLCAASAWGGSLWVFALCIFPAALPSLDKHRALFAAMASRLSTISGMALGTLVVTGIANACYEVQSLAGLVRTSYGWVVLIKVLLLGVLVVIGATNRYISVPLLRHWAGEPPGRLGTVSQLLMGRRLLRLADHADISSTAPRFALKVQIEALLVGVVLFWTAVLLHSIPAAHLVHMHGHF